MFGNLVSPQQTSPSEDGLTFESLRRHSVVDSGRDRVVFLLKLLEGFSVDLVLLQRICGKNKTGGSSISQKLNHSSLFSSTKASSIVCSIIACTQSLQVLGFVDDIFCISSNSRGGVLVHIVGNNFPSKDTWGKKYCELLNIKQTG